MIITIDGAAGTGKSTVAKKVAEQLMIAYFDTGAMYRAFAAYILSSHINPLDVDKVIDAIKGFHFTFDGIGSKKTYFVNHADVTLLLRTPEVTEISSIVSQYPQVRQSLHSVQKEFASQHTCVFEGRDLGTVIFPQADYKFFLTASDEVRASRRFEEMLSKGMKVSYNDVLHAIRERDNRDQGRKVAPLKCAEDAHLIDTSHLSVDQVVDSILKIIGNKS
jgi:cytidylate kinase